MPSEQQLTKAIINMAVEAWHFKEAFEQMIAKAKPEDQVRYRNQLKWSLQRTKEALTTAGLHVADIPEGMPFNPSLKITAVNMDEFEPGDELVIEQVVEPTILTADNRIAHIGSATLATAAEFNAASEPA